MTPPESRNAYRRRLLLAFGFAIAIHEIVIGLGGFLRIPHATEPRRAAQTAVVLEYHKPVRVAIHTPPPAPIATPAPVRQRAAPRAKVIVHKLSGGSRGGPKLAVHTQRIVHHKETLPIWWTAPHGAKLVASTGTGTKPSPGPAAGTGAGTGTGSGAGSASGAGGGTGGNGSGVNAEAPCGEPLFYGLHAQYNPRDGSFLENVRVHLTLGNGQTLDGDFHYPWHYPNEAQNPFSPRSDIPQDEPIPAQLPPSGFDVSKEPLAVRLTLKHTGPDGRTFFAPCANVSKSDL